MCDVVELEKQRRLKWWEVGVGGGGGAWREEGAGSDEKNEVQRKHVEIK